MNGLAGPLHGLANQECLKWLTQLKDFHRGDRPNSKTIEEFVRKTLGEGRVIPGYGHAVLRNTDPRFLHLKSFAQRNIKDDYICDLATECFETIPKILGTIGKIKNPYPNVDAYSGALLQHYGTLAFIQAWTNTTSSLWYSECHELWAACPTVSGLVSLVSLLSVTTVSTSQKSNSYPKNKSDLFALLSTLQNHAFLA